MNNKLNITKTQVFGFESAMRGCRNPLNSWHLSDSILFDKNNPTRKMVDHPFISEVKLDNEYLFGEKDLGLAQRLIKAGSEHMKFMRQIQVWADMDMTRFFWSEMDTYKFNSKNSCSTMHKLLNPKNEVTIDMFDVYEEDYDVVLPVIKRINEIREKFLTSTVNEEKRILKRRAKTLLFESFLQLRTVNTNYAELRNCVIQRRHHQLKEDWQDCFCKWVTTLPYAKELIFCGYEDDFERLSQ